MSYVIQAVLSNAQHPEYGQVTIPFPIPNQNYEKFLSWTKTIGYDLPAAAAAELSEHWEQLDLGRARGQDPGMGGMSLG